MRPSEPPSERQRILRQLGRYTGFGLAWALSVLFFLLIGYWLDQRLGTLPLFTMVGAFVGAAGGFISLIRGITAAGRADDDRAP